MSFLIVGHTHEDVDQTFSKISHALNKNDAVTLTDLQDIIRQSQQPMPKTSTLHAVWNISGWLEEYVNTIMSVTSPRTYRYGQKQLKEKLVIPPFRGSLLSFLWHFVLLQRSRPRFHKTSQIEIFLKYKK